MPNFWLFIAIALGCPMQIISEQEIGVTFNNFDLYTTMNYAVDHMEVDLFKDDCRSILVSSWPHLISTDSTSNEIIIQLIFATSFTQINRTHVAITEYDKGCIKILERNTTTIRLLAGTYNSRGFADGPVGVARFGGPRELLLDARNPGKLLVTDDTNNAIRSVDIETGVVTTIIRGSGLNQPRGMAWEGDQLLVTNHYYYISQLSWSFTGNVTNKKLVGETYPGNLNGDFEVAELSYLNEIKAIQKDLFAVVDYGERRLRLIDTTGKKVLPVCFHGEIQCYDGSEFYSTPNSILVVDNAVYVGLSSAIYKLTGDNLPCPHRNITTMLLPDQLTVEVELTDDHVAVLPEGFYRLETTYRSAACVFYVTVKGSENLPGSTGTSTSVPEECPNMNRTYYLPVSSNKVAVLLEDGRSKRFPEGVYRQITEHNSIMCIYHIIVKRFTEVKKLAFNAQYFMDCNIINQNEYGVFMLRSIMQMRRNQFQSICGEDCTVSADLGQDFTCYSGILSLHWPTNITYPSNTQTISDGLSRKLRRKINRTEIMKTLEIYVISHQPPIIQAKMDHLEQAVTLVLQ